jgi:hypothetical protein
MLRLMASLALVALALPAAADENWPRFRGPRADGITNSTGLPTTWSESKNVKWKTPIHGRGWSSPVVWGEQIWLTTATPDGKVDHALCLDKGSGRIVHDIKLWENEKPSPLGNELNSYASCTPVIEDGRVYVHFGSYGTACLESASGKILWQRRDLPCEHWRGPGSSPILFENLLIFHMDGYDHQYVVALDKGTGQTVWKTDRDVEYGTDNGDIMKAFSTPLVIDVDGKLQLVSPTAKACLAYDPRTGKEIWRIRYASHSVAATPLFAHGTLYINTGFGKADLLAVRPDGQGDVTASHVLWAAKKGIGCKPGQVVVDGLVLNVHDGGVASCLDAATGEELWSRRLGGEFSAALLAGDGKVYFCDHTGSTTVVKPAREYIELAKNQLDDGCMASPAVTGKSLILRTRSALYRIEE